MSANIARAIRNQEQSGPRLIVSRQIIEMRFLKKDGHLGGIFMTRIAKNHDRSVNHCAKFRAANLILLIWLAESCLRRRAEKCKNEKQQTIAEIRVTYPGGRALFLWRRRPDSDYHSFIYF